MDPAHITLVILALSVIAFLSNRIPLEIIAVAVCLALFFTGVLTLPEALAGFGDPTVLFIAALFVVSESLDATGITAWAGQKVVARAGRKRVVIMVVVSLLAAGLSALISPTGAVAALYPLVAIVAARAGIRTSKLLMPLAFAAHAGSLLLLTGTPVNIIVSDASAAVGGRAFGFFEFALVGLPLLLGTVLIMAIFGSRLLPDRAGAMMPVDLAEHARLMRSQYSLETGAIPTVDASDGVTEVIIPPRSPLIGASFSPGMATPSGELVLLGARRGIEPLLGPEFTAQAGDTLLLQGSWEDLDRHTANARHVIAVDAPNRLRRSVPFGQGAKRALIILAVMVALLSTGLVPPAVAALLAAGALILTRAVTITQAYRSISWTTVVLIAGMVPLSEAFLQTGAADLVAHGILSVVGGAGPTVVLLVLCLTTLVLGQIISNVATVLILVPVAFSLAANLGVAVEPFMMALTVVGAASFLTPIATPANLMVMEPGGYRFGDYWKLGLPLALLFLTVATLYVPLIWPFG